MEDKRIFYQQAQRNHPLIFSGQIPGIPVPNMHLRSIIQFYDKFSAFHFNLILRNGVHLSILGENGYSYVSIAQIINGKMTKSPCFEHDGFGEATVYFTEYDLGQFISDLVNNETDWIHGS